MDNAEDRQGPLNRMRRRQILSVGTLAAAVTGAISLASEPVRANAASSDRNPSSSYVPLAEKGSASGVATLDAGVKIPTTQIPELFQLYAPGLTLPAWKPQTDYQAGALIASPSGSVVRVKTNFTSGTVFSTDDFTLVSQAAPMPRFYDETGNYTDRGAIFTLSRSHDPVGFQPMIWANVAGKGDNSTFKGVVAGQFLARDRSDVDASNKGVLYALQAVVAPKEDRNNVPFDDVVGISIVNQGTGIGTDALYFGNNRADRSINPYAKDFNNVIQCDMSSNSFIRSNGKHDVGISLSGAEIATSAIRLGNAQSISWNDINGNIVHSLRMSAKGTLRLLEGGIDIRADKSVYFNNKIVLSNNAPLYGLRNGSTSECELIKVTSGDNVAIFGSKATLLAGGGITLSNVTSQPAPASGGGTLYVEGGALKYRGSFGTITTIGAA